MLRLKGCVKCGGDLLLQDEDWQCFQCGRYFYSTPPWVTSVGKAPGGIPVKLRCVRTRGGRVTRGISPVMRCPAYKVDKAGGAA